MAVARHAEVAPLHADRAITPTRSMSSHGILLVLYTITQNPTTMRKIYSLIAAVILSIAFIPNSSAQVNFGGVTFNNDIVSWGDMYNLSFTTHNYGTARSMAMGNAFTALGADMASASINPAGIGMYLNSDISVTPLMTFTKSPTEGADFNNSDAFKDRSDRFSLASAGGVFTAYRGTGALTNFNIGFVYNRIADFNQNSKFASFGNEATHSMANVFCTLSNVDGLMTNSDGTMPFGNDPYYWGAVLAYKNGLTNKDDEGWYIDRIGRDAIIDQYTAVETRGSIGEYAITMGFNFSDIFYMGATLGIQNVNYRRNVFYGEDYLYNDGQYPSGGDMPYQLTYMNYMQSTRLSGSGVNFKVGITARPVPWLRIGVAYHTPTYYSLSLRYSAEMWSETFSAGDNPDGYDLDNYGYMSDYVESPIWEDSGPYSWNFRSPSRLMFGVAVTIAKRLILSADYERSWYQSIRLQKSPIEDLSYTATMKDYFRGANTLRIGGEFRALPFMDLRLGYIFSDGGLRYKNELYSHPMTRRENYITAGLGFKLGKTTYLDLAYQYNKSERTPYQSFFATEAGNEANNIEAKPVITNNNRHLAVLTLGFRF